VSIKNSETIFFKLEDIRSWSSTSDDLVPSALTAPRLKPFSSVDDSTSLHSRARPLENSSQLSLLTYCCLLQRWGLRRTKRTVAMVRRVGKKRGEGVAITTKFLMTEDERKGDYISYELLVTTVTRVGFCTTVLR
jgi:hypothetical protein